MAINEDARNLAKSGPGKDAFNAAVRIAIAAWDRVHSLNTVEEQQRLCAVAGNLAEIVAKSGLVTPNSRNVEHIYKEGNRKYFLNLFGVAWRVVHDSNDDGNLAFLNAILDSLYAIANAEGDE